MADYDYLKMAAEVRKNILEKKKQEEEAHKKELENGNFRNLRASDLPEKEQHFDHPSTMENSTATVLYIIVMLVGLIFNDRWLIWIMASLIYFKFIGRHKKK